MIKVGIYEGIDYKAGELIRLLLNHPDVELKWVTGKLYAGKPLTAFHRGLVGETSLVFTDEPLTEEVDVVFLCEEPQNEEMFADSSADTFRVIDLSSSSRDDASMEDGNSEGLVYGLPEHSRKALVRGAVRAVVPGELATALELSLLPLAKHLMLNSEIHSTAIYGSTEAGENLNEDIHSRRSRNVIPTALLSHDDISEVTRLLGEIQSSYRSKVNVVGLDGPFTRGIVAVTYLTCPVALEEIVKIYEDYYDDHNFTFVTPEVPDLKDVVNTNKCLIHLRKSDDTLIIVSVLDNLLKGAAGTAVHIMNLLFGLHERTGLALKASAH